MSKLEITKVVFWSSYKALMTKMQKYIDAHRWDQIKDLKKKSIRFHTCTSKRHLIIVLS